MAEAKQPRSATAAASRKPPAGVAAPLSAAERENPGKLSGDDLRALAHRRGIARSEAAGMSDEKLRQQLNLIINRQYAEAD